MEKQSDVSIQGLFQAISFQLEGIKIALFANSVIYMLILFSNTNGHEIALSVPILATAVFTVVWGDASLKSQISSIKDVSKEKRDYYAYKDIASQPYKLLRLMNLFLALAFGLSQFSILFS